MTPDPWPDTLIHDLVAGFTQRGVPAVGAPDRMYVEGAMVATPLVLTGEIHNSSTEARRLGLMAHVSGIVRLFDQAGTPLVTKPVSARVRWLPDVKLPPDQPVLEGLLNVAIDEFVTKVVPIQRSRSICSRSGGSTITVGMLGVGCALLKTHTGASSTVRGYPNKNQQSLGIISSASPLG